ncbi:NAD(P)H-hydrate dehydratase [Variovorax boronicumulans]|uniref:NAD(P)H-hydrate dehydratase n=1 Tax=Variovorax boronicumulans TaxID=436515 RepID=UPI001C5936A5
MAAAAAKARALTPAVLARWPLPDAGETADKESRGHVLVVAGSHEMPGAALLAAVAALRSGAGKLTIAAPGRVAEGLALAIPEARVLGLAESRAGGFLQAGCKVLRPVAPSIAALVLGPGMLDEKRSAAFVRALLPCFRDSVTVLDALAMSAVHRGPFDQPVVITPHAGEMAHLSGLSKEIISADPLRVAREAAARWNACVVLKGPTTYLALPDGTAWRFDGGTAGLATSGSGDTLAGLIGGLAARGATLLQAAAWGVMLHARAGHALRKRQGPLGYLARELSGEVPALMAQLARRQRSPA